MARQDALKPRSPTERELGEQIRALATLLGYRRFHHWTSLRSAPGWPDEVLLRPPRAIFAELKTEHGRPTRAQTDTLDALALCGLETYLWRPSMLQAILAYLRPRERPRAFGPGSWPPG